MDSGVSVAASLPKKFRRLCAKIHFESGMGSDQGFNIEGMSGGPIFGLRHSNDSMQHEYRLIGLQGSVALCVDRPFLRPTLQNLPPTPGASSDIS